MIQIHVYQKFKSLQNVFIEFLPDFTIISGINGAGKSHLLSGIEQNMITVLDEMNVPLENKRYIHFIQLSSK